MTKQKVLITFKKFQNLSNQDRRQFFSAFEKKMIYRTTKTENPETTLQMVQRVLGQYQVKR